MLKECKNVFECIYRFQDILIVVASLLAAYYLRFENLDPEKMIHRIEYAVFFPTYLVMWLYLSHRFKLYHSKRLTRFSCEAGDIVKITSLCLVIAMIPAFYVRQFPLSRLFLIYLWCLQTGTLLVFRLILRKALRHFRRKGYNYRRVLIVGNNSRADNLYEKIRSTPEYGLRVIGIIDTNDRLRMNPANGYSLLGELNSLEQILRHEVVDLVIVTLPIKSYYSEIERIITLCETVGVEVEIPAQLFNLKISKACLADFDNIQLINFYTSPKLSWQLVVKRMIDLSLVTLMLIVLLPLLLLIAFLVKATSPGPVFFKQRRVGHNGRLFTLLKFRTMVENAEALKRDLMELNELDGPVFKIRNDPRVTRIGRILRKTSMDELPQLFNVFRGEMSLVGPRPPVPDEVDQYRLDDRRRLSMKPGITCYWQVCGRNQISFDKWMELDRRYIDEWSLWLDVKILLRTIPAVLKTSGAC